MFTLAFVGSILYYYITSKVFLLDVAHKTNYYETATIQIKQNLEHQIANEDLKKAITSVITEEKIKTDVDKMIQSLFKKKDIRNEIKDEIKIEFQSTMKNILKDQSFDEKSFNDLVNTLTNSYMKDLFPYSEYMLLQNKLIPISYLLLMSFFFLLMLVLSVMVSLFINKKRPLEIFYRSNFFSGILMICPFCFCHLYSLFKNFYYSNVYFSLYIKETFYTVVNLLGLFGIVLIISTIILEIYSMRKGKKL